MLARDIEIKHKSCKNRHVIRLRSKRTRLGIRNKRERKERTLALIWSGPTRLDSTWLDIARFPLSSASVFATAIRPFRRQGRKGERARAERRAADARVPFLFAIASIARRSRLAFTFLGEIPR